MMKLAQILIFALAGSMSILGNAQDITKEQFREDAEYFVKALKEGHPNLEWYTPTEEIMMKLQKLPDSFDPQKPDYQDLYYKMNEVLRAIGCGHTGLKKPEAHYDYVDSVNQFIPFEIRLIDGRVYVDKSYSTKLSKGDEILSINGNLVDEVVNDLMHSIPLEMGIKTKGLRTIEVSFPYLYAIEVFPLEKHRLTVRKLGTNNEVALSVVAVPFQEAMNRSIREFSLKQEPITYSDWDEEVAYLKIGSFQPVVFKQHEINFSDTIAAVMEEISNRAYSTLILDLRWNIGGNMSYPEELMTYFIDEPYQYFDKGLINKMVAEGSTKIVKSRNMLPMFEKQYPNIKLDDGQYVLDGSSRLINPAENRWKGDVIVLVNGLTFSASASIAAHLKSWSYTIVGETPGGAYNGLNTGPMLTVTLPNSGMRLAFRAIHTKYDLNQDIKTIEVDVEVTPTLDALLQGFDPIDEVVAELIKY